MAEAVAKEEFSPPIKKGRTEHLSDNTTTTTTTTTTTQLDHSDTVDSTTTDKCTELSQDELKDELFMSFGDFEVDRVLGINTEQKGLAVTGRVRGRDGTAVVHLQKKPFNEDKIHQIFSDATSLSGGHRNDVYYERDALISPELNEIHTTIIFPASEKHIRKYERQQSSFVDETPELYQQVTQPYIRSSVGDKEWIYNILDHKKEVERIVFEDKDPEVGFVLVQDLKWSGEQMEDLYLLAIIHRRDLSSIRDLRAEHIPLLRNIRDKGMAAIKNKYGIEKHKLRVYMHYQPSYYHLHVHFTALSFDAPGTWAGKAHLLSTVISNLEMVGDYYTQAVLSFTVKDNHPLRELLKAKGYFTE